MWKTFVLQQRLNEVNILEQTAVRHLNKKQMMTVFAKKRSKQYQQEGYKHAVNISNAFLLERGFAFALDTCIMFLPIALWELLMVMMLGGLMPVTLLTSIEVATFVLIVLSMFIFNPILSAKSGGQTLGRYFYDLKIVKKNHREASTTTLMAREIIGFSLPTLALFIFFNIIGVVAYWILNTVFLLLHPKHISIIDLFLGTRMVVLRNKKQTQAVQQPEIIEEKEIKNTIDLHIHSHFSDDGQYNVEEIFQMAAKQGLKTISICDHNSVKGNMIAKRMSELYHVDYVPGVELDCRYKETHLRVLGYFVNFSSEIFAHLENESLKREKNASLRRVEAFEHFSGIQINVDALLDKNRFQKITGEMIASQVLNNETLREHPLLQPYLFGDKKDDPITAMNQDFFVKGAPCYVEVRHPKLEDVLDIIQLTNGIAVLSWAKDTLAQGEELFEEICEKGIEGIEVFTPYYTSSEMAELLKFAKDHKLLVTAGSDFHGASRPDIALGETNCPIEAEKLVAQFIEVRKGKA